MYDPLKLKWYRGQLRFKSGADTSTNLGLIIGGGLKQKLNINKTFGLVQLSFSMRTVSEVIAFPRFNIKFPFTSSILIYILGKLSASLYFTTKKPSES